MSRDSDNDLPPGGSSYVDSQSRRENLHRSVDGDKGRSGSSDGKKKPKSLRSIMDKNIFNRTLRRGARRSDRSLRDGDVNKSLSEESRLQREEYELRRIENSKLAKLMAATEEAREENRTIRVQPGTYSAVEFEDLLEQYGPNMGLEKREGELEDEFHIRVNRERRKKKLVHMLTRLRVDESRLQAGIKGLENDIRNEEDGLDEGFEEKAEVAEEDLKKKKKKKKAKKHLLPEVKKRAKHMGLLQKNMSSIAINQHDVINPEDDDNFEKSVEHMQYRNLIVGNKAIGADPNSDLAQQRVGSVKFREQMHSSGFYRVQVEDQDKAKTQITKNTDGSLTEQGATILLSKISTTQTRMAQVFTLLMGTAVGVGAMQQIAITNRAGQTSFLHSYAGQGGISYQLITFALITCCPIIYLRFFMSVTESEIGLRTSKFDMLARLLSFLAMLVAFACNLLSFRMELNWGVKSRTLESNKFWFLDGPENFGVSDSLYLTQWYILSTIRFVCLVASFFLFSINLSDMYEYHGHGTYDIFVSRSNAVLPAAPTELVKIASQSPGLGLHAK